MEIHKMPGHGLQLLLQGLRGTLEPLKRAVQDERRLSTLVLHTTSKDPHAHWER
jgi:hypothetical protein